jgi:hypothetical protein
VLLGPANCLPVCLGKVHLYQVRGIQHESGARGLFQFRLGGFLVRDEHQRGRQRVEGDPDGDRRVASAGRQPVNGEPEFEQFQLDVSESAALFRERPEVLRGDLVVLHAVEPHAAFADETGPGLAEYRLLNIKRQVGQAFALGIRIVGSWGVVKEGPKPGAGNDLSHAILLSAQAAPLCRASSAKLRPDMGFSSASCDVI